MKRSLIIFCQVLILLFFLPGCIERQQTDQGNVSGLFSYIPYDATMIFTVNFSKLSKLAVYNHVIEDLNKKRTDSVQSLYESYKKTLI